MKCVAISGNGSCRSSSLFHVRFYKMGLPARREQKKRRKNTSLWWLLPSGLRKKRVYRISNIAFTMFACYYAVFWCIILPYQVLYTHASQKKREIVVSCVGDSLTYGLGASKLHTLTYPALLQTHLQSQFPTVQWTIHNFGDSGKTALKGTGRHSYWNTETYKKSLSVQPNIVIIQLGNTHIIFTL